MDPAPSGIAILDRDTLTKILAAVPFRPSHRLHPVGFYWSADVHRLLRNINKDFRAVVSSEAYRQRLSNAPVGRVMLREALQQLSTCVALDATFAVRCAMTGFTAVAFKDGWCVAALLTDASGDRKVILSDQAVLDFRAATRVQFWDKQQGKDVYEPWPPVDMSREETLECIHAGFSAYMASVIVTCRYAKRDERDQLLLDEGRTYSGVQDERGHRTFTMQVVRIRAVGQRDDDLAFENLGLADTAAAATAPPLTIDWSAEGRALLQDIGEMSGPSRGRDVILPLPFPAGTTFLTEEEAFLQEPERDFYEDMFCNFTGGDMDDEENVRTYWTDGMWIERKRDHSGRWVYTCEHE